MMRVLGLFVFLVMSAPLIAAETSTVSPATSLVKMSFGLVLVLAVMFALAWLAKRYLPQAGAQASTIRVVGGVSVGTRERVVVLEVAGRWLVVGVAAGQVSSIANLDPGNTAPLAMDMNAPAEQAKATHPPFAHWLQQAVAGSIKKFSDK